MARITVEDCISKVPNHFDLIVLAARRARDLSSGELPRISRDHDKNTIVALREIASGTVSPAEMHGRIIEAISVAPVQRVPDLDMLPDVVISEDESEDEAEA